MLSLLGAWISAFAGSPEPSAEPASPTADKDQSRVSASFTNDLEVRYQRFDPSPLVLIGGPPPKFIEEVNRFTGRVHSGPWSLNLQLDQVAFVGLPYLVDGERAHTPPDLVAQCGLPSCVQSPFGEYFYVNPEKVAVRYEKKKFEAVLGDYYAAFGYGAALNLNRNVDIDVDSSIQGARLIGDIGPFELTALAGTLNRQQVFVDNPNFGTLQGDYRHLVGGTRAVLHDLGPASVGAHAVGYDFTETYGFAGAFDEIGSSPDAVIGGATLELYSVGGIDWQLEGDVIQFPLDETGGSPLFEGGSPEMGHSLYGSAQFMIGRTVWQVDGKKYSNFQRVNRPLAREQYQVVVPPTLEYERAVNYNTAAVLGSDDIYGGRVRTDLALGQVTPYLSVAAFRDEDLTNSAQHAPAPETIFVGQLGVEVLFDDVTVLTNAMGRAELRDGDNGRDTQLYGDLDVKFPLWGGAHADVIVFGQRFVPGPEREQFGTEIPSPWTEASFSATLSPNHSTGITGYFDYSTNPFAKAGGNLWSPYTFGAVEVYVKPASAFTLRAFHGGYAAGIRCSGGQCRFVPAFTGTRFAVTASF